jgi:hypothetical protein
LDLGLFGAVSFPDLEKLFYQNSCLTRAPVLVALALIEGGMKYEDAVQFIRQ